MQYHLPLLAEAAPDEFLDAIESVLVDLSTTPFHELFAQEGSGGVGERNYTSGLLWALEGLAWHPDYLSRVAVILADIASIDPGGSWSNRPANSLADIFLPWHVQTTAPFEKRKAVIKTVLKEQLKEGWALLLALLPHSHSSTSGCHRPVWREFIPRDWKEGISKREYWEQIISLTELAVELAKEDTKKLVELVKRFPDLPRSAHESVLAHLSSEVVVGLAEPERLPIWEKLDELVRRHRRFSDAGWALPEEMLTKIEETAILLSPSSPEFKFQHLFSNRDFDLFDEMGNYDEQRKRLDNGRQAAVSEILGDSNLNAVLEFAAKVAAPHEVGRALGSVASSELEGAVLPSLLYSEDEVLVRVVAGFTLARFWELKIDWVDSVLERDWTPEHKAKFLTLIPFNEEIWERVETHLGDTHEALYWKKATVDPYGPDRDLTIPIKKLIKCGRAGAAVTCAAHMANDRARFDESLATRALQAVLEPNSGFDELDNYQTVELINLTS